MARRKKATPSTEPEEVETQTPETSDMESEDSGSQSEPQVEETETKAPTKKKPKSKYGDERVLCVKTEDLWKEIPYFTGQIPVAESFDSIRELFTWELREQVEEDPGFKQIIPYILLVKTADNRNPASASVLTYSRGSASAEDRLHGKRSCGFGGHVNPVDGQDLAVDDLIGECISRELLEEVGIPTDLTSDSQALAWINDDSTDVGQVHLGLAVAVTLPPHFAGPEAKEVSIHDPRWERVTIVSLDQMRNMDQWETWSPYLLSSYSSIISKL